MWGTQPQSLLKLLSCPLTHYTHNVRHNVVVSAQLTTKKSEVPFQGRIERGGQSAVIPTQ